jgi:hypothetical protein
MIGNLALFAADYELVFLDRDVEVIRCETGDRKRDTQAVFACLLNVIRRITVGRGARHPVQRAFEILEAKQKWAIE